MRAALMTEPGKISLVEQEIPKITDDEVLVKIEHVGLCGSDLHYYTDGRIGDFIVEDPIVLGHEAAGKVVEVGKKVTSLEKGDLVALEPGITCGRCRFCRTGRYNLCPDVRFLATPPYHGAFIEYVAYPEDLCFKLSEGMDTMEGALIEPLAVGFHAANQGKAKIGNNAAILGSGTIGLTSLMALLAQGVKEVYVTDLVDLRLDKAQSVGARKAFNAKKSNVVEEIMKATNNEGVDIVIETAGSEVTAQQTVDLVKRGGTIVLVGMAADPVYTFDFGKLQSKEAVLTTVFRYRNIYPVAIKAVSEKIIDVKQVVSDVFGLSQIQKAFDYAIHNPTKTVKVIIDMNK